MLTFSQEERYIAIRKVTWWGIIINILLSLLKLVGGVMGQSQALIADGLHSLSDLISDGVVLAGAHYSSRHADTQYPYGYGRFETLASVMVGGFLIALALAMLIEAGQRLLSDESLLPPTGITIVIILLSILFKEALYQYTLRIAKKVHSHMLELHAWHHRTDSISSLVVLVGLIGSIVGMTWLDAVAAIGVSLMIAHIGGKLGGEGIRELVDNGLDQSTVIQIRQTIESVEGVRTLHGLRTRRMGAKILVDVHVLVHPMMSVSEGHQIGEAVRTRLMEAFTEISDILIHIDAENDEQYLVQESLPSRGEILSRLQHYWQGLLDIQGIDHITLHYLEGKLTVEVYLSLKIVKDINEAIHLSKHLNDLAVQDSDIQDVHIYYY